MKKMIPLISLLIIFTSHAAYPFYIELVPSTDMVKLGDVFSVDIMFNEVPEAVGDYKIGVHFDKALLSDLTESKSISEVFGGALGIPGLDTTAAWGVDESESLNIVNVAEYCYHLQSGDLELLQQGRFRIATLYFSAEVEGIADFYISSTDIGGAGIFNGETWIEYGSRINVDDIIGSSVIVTPIPSSLFLFFSGLVCFLRILKKRH